MSRSSTLGQFAHKHGLRRTKDEVTREPMIEGRVGSIHPSGATRLSVVIMNATANLWAYRRKACLGAGMQLSQDGDAEGVCTFDPRDEEQAQAAIKAAEPYKLRKLSLRNRKALIEYGRTYRYRVRTTR